MRNEDRAAKTRSGWRLALALAAAFALVGLVESPALAGLRVGDRAPELEGARSAGNKPAKLST